jgi:hypothetical protein
MTKWNTTGSEARGSAARNTSQRLSQPDNTADPLTPKNVGGSRLSLIPVSSGTML